MLHNLITIQPILETTCAIEDGVHTVVIAHFSVQEFLTRNEILRTEAMNFRIEHEVSQLFIARSCLAYLYLCNSFEHRNERFPLRGYPWFNWERHVLPESFIANSQVRRKAMILLKLLGIDFINSNCVFGTQTHSEHISIARVCFAVTYWYLIWLLHLY